MSLPTRNINIFEVLGKLSKKNIKYYKDLSNEQQKEIHPLVVMRWLSGISSERQIMLLNEFVNPYVFPLNKHKELLVDLLTVCTSGQGAKYKWIKQKSKSSTKLTKTTQVVQQYFGYNAKHASDIIPLLSDDEIISYAEQLGTQPEDVKLITKELKSRT